MELTLPDTDWVTVSVTLTAAFGAAFLGAWLGLSRARAARREDRQEQALTDLRFLVADVSFYAQGLAHEHWDIGDIPDRWRQAGLAMDRLRPFWRRSRLATIIDLEINRAMRELEEAWEATAEFADLIPTTGSERAHFMRLSVALQIIEGRIEARLLHPVSWRKNVRALKANPGERDRRGSAERAWRNLIADDASG